MFLEKHGWVLFIVVGLVNVFVWRARARKHAMTDPSLVDSYRSLIRGMFFWVSVPWVVMGIGIEIGGVPTLNSFLRPAEGNAWVLAFIASIVLLWIVTAWWLFLRGGAEKLVQHSALFNRPPTSARTIKVFFVLMLLGGVAGLAMMSRMPR